MRRRLLAILLACVALAAIYWFAVRQSTVTPRVSVVQPTSMIGSGDSAVGVAADGSVLSWLPPPEEGSLPELPLSAAPEGRDRLQGPMLKQAQVLGATPPALRPYVAGSYYGTSGVDVELTSGVELRFGSPSQAARKWRAAATVLADPTVIALDYVNLYAPGRPSFGGSGHTLPGVP